jgi:HEAT repeat protein
MDHALSRADEVREDELLAELGAGGVDRGRRRALLSELRRVGSERSIDELRRSLEEDDVKTKIAAISALEGVGSDEAVDVLGECVRTQTGPPFTFAARALWTVDARRAMPVFMRALEERGDDLSESDKRVVIHGLARAPHRSQVPLLLRALQGKSPLTRRVAAMALSRIRAPESEAALQDAARSLSWFRGLPVRRELNRRHRGHSE